MSTSERERLKELERENRELKWVNTAIMAVNICRFAIRNEWQYYRQLEESTDAA
jgi:hypothetical protein